MEGVVFFMLDACCIATLRQAVFLVVFKRNRG